MTKSTMNKNEDKPENELLNRELIIRLNRDNNYDKPLFNPTNYDMSELAREFLRTA